MPVRILTHPLLAAVLFFAIYTPPLSGNSSMNQYSILLSLGVVMLLFRSIYPARLRSVWRSLSKPPVAATMALVFISSLYVATVSVLSNEPDSSVGDLRLVQNNLINIVIIVVALLNESLDNKGFTSLQKIESLFTLGALQGVFGWLSFAIPQLKQYSNYLYQAGGADNTYVMGSRVFGVSADFTYGTPIYHGMLAGVAVYFALKYRKNYWFSIALIVSSAFLNGRTGVLIFALVAVGALIIHFRANIFGLFWIGSLISIVMFVIYQALEKVAPSTYKFFQSFLVDTQNLLLYNESNGNYSVLFSDISVIPKGWALIFGEGQRVYDVAQGFRSDIGFTNDLFIGGFVYVALFYISIIAFMLRKSGRMAPLYIVILLALGVASFKGETFKVASIVFLIAFVKMALIDMAQIPIKDMPSQEKRVVVARD